MSTTIKLRRDTSVNWASNNPILADGEFGIVTDQRRVKIGNGSSAWNSLQYIDAVTAAELSAYATKASPTFTGNVALPSTTTIGGVNSAEINALKGLITTTNIQYQLDGKMDSIELESITIAPVPAVAGTYYYDSSDYNIYRRVSGSWQSEGRPSLFTTYIHESKLYIGDEGIGGPSDVRLFPIVNPSPEFVDVTATNSITSTIYNAGPTALGGNGGGAVSAEVAFVKLNALLPYIDEFAGIQSYATDELAGVAIGENKLYINTTNRTFSLSVAPP